MRVTSHQPSFFPWIGYWNKLASADLVIMTCGVRFDYGGYQNRVWAGSSWMTLPVGKEYRQAAIKDVRFDFDALPKIRQRLEQTYASRRAPNREVVAEIIEQTFCAVDNNFLLDFNVGAFDAVSRVLGLTPEVVFDIEPPDEGLSKTENLMERIKRYVHRPATYLAGRGQLNYIDTYQWASDLSILLQTPKPGLDQGTILQSIAHRDARNEVLEAAEWRELLLGKEYSGYSPALG